MSRISNIASILLLLSAVVALVASHDRDGNKVVVLPLVPHHVQKARRHLGGSEYPKEERPTRYHRRRLDGTEGLKAEQVAALFQGYGTHYADLWCGSPPQRQTVIVDTGSGVTAFPCSGCTECGVPDYHVDKLFVEDDSSTFTKLACGDCLRGRCAGDDCRIGMSYQEGSSWTAYEAMDSCYVGGLHDHATPDNVSGDDLDPFHAPAFAFDMKFGCQTHLTGLFITQLADGIMGMDNAPAAFFQQMFHANKISHQAFALCFGHQDLVSKDGTVAGAMSMGGVDERLHDGDVVFAASSRGSGFYGVHLRRIYLRGGGGGDSVVSTDPDLQVVPLDVSEDTLNHGQVIIDSGTTDTYFSRQIASSFKSIFKDLTGKDYSHTAMSMTTEEVNALPTIIFQISGDEEANRIKAEEDRDRQVVGLANQLDPDHPLDLVIAVPPAHYMEFDVETRKWESRFYVDESSGGVLGANAMMGHDVLFDIENHRIGWAESSCDYTVLMKEFYDTDVTGKGGEEDTERQNHPEGNNGHDKTSPPPDKNGGTTLPDDGTKDSNGEIPGPTQDSFCSGMACQAFFLVAVVSAVVVAAVMFLRRAPSGPSYEVTGSELELPSANLDEGVRYRDDPAEPPGSGYEDDDGEDDTDLRLT